MTLLLSLHSYSQEKTLTIYQDADISHHQESAKAIQQGIEVAFNEIDNEIQGYKIEFKYLDQRSNIIRSKRNYQTFLNDPSALVIFSGNRSPPLIKNRTFINKNEALTLVPWAAGGPVTRYPSKENWIFRLSVDDTQAAPVIIDYAINTKQCKKPHLFLENTPWGDSNLIRMRKELVKYNINNPDVTRFNLSIKQQGAQTLLREVLNKGSDCIVLVSNASEGVIIANEVINLTHNERLPIISHWGITGGDFHKKINTQQRDKLDLHFIQSCFSFTNSEQSVLAKKVFTQLKQHSNGKIAEPKDLASAVGFIHAYDLTKLLIQAIQQTKLTSDMPKNRNAIRLALENIKKPIQGLVKNYTKPFSVFNKNTNNNAHEALSSKDYCMGNYGASDEILVSQNHENTNNKTINEH